MAEDEDPWIVYDDKTPIATYNHYESGDPKRRTPGEKKRDREYELGRARQERADQHALRASMQQPEWTPPQRNTSWARPIGNAERRGQERGQLMEDLRERAHIRIVPKSPPTSDKVVLRFPEPAQYPPSAKCSRQDLSVLLGEDMQRFREICKGMTGEQRAHFGHVPSKTALDRLQIAHRQRVVAAHKFKNYPDTIFRYYRVSDDTGEDDRHCIVQNHKVMNGTEMVELPCHHKFTVKALYEYFTLHQAVPESWGCLFCRQGVYKIRHHGEDPFNFKAASGGGVHDLADALAWAAFARPDQHEQDSGSGIIHSGDGDAEDVVMDDANPGLRRQQALLPLSLHHRVMRHTSARHGGGNHHIPTSRSLQLQGAAHDQTEPVNPPFAHGEYPFPTDLLDASAEDRYNWHETVVCFDKAASVAQVPASIPEPLREACIIRCYKQKIPMHLVDMVALFCFVHYTIGETGRNRWLWEKMRGAGVEDCCDPDYQWNIVDDVVCDRQGMV